MPFRVTFVMLISLVTAPFLSCEKSDPTGPGEAVTYKINYDGSDNTGGKVPEAQTKTEGVALTVSGNTGNLEKTGHAFEGWNTEADGSGTDYVKGASYTADEEVTLYAKWAPVQTYFEDDFNRPDTEDKNVGTDWITTNSVVKIVNNKLYCAKIKPDIDYMGTALYKQSISDKKYELQQNL